MKNYIIEKEVWKDVLEFPEMCEVSNLGNVRTKDRIITRKDGIKYPVSGRMLSPTKDAQGYLRVTLSKNNKCYNRKVHRLVAESFVENTHEKPQVNHINGVKCDNRASNLEWMTSSENNRHAHATGLNTSPGKNLMGERNPSSVLTRNDVKRIRKLRKKGYKYREIAEIFPVSISQISNICKTKYWK